MEQSPKPVSPRNSNAIASAINFTWTSVPQATDYELAIGNEADFVTSDLSINTGPTNVLILYEALPEDGRTHYWKVRAMHNAKWSEWSEAVAFVAGTTEGPIQSPGTRRQSNRQPAPQTTAVDSAVNSPKFAAPIAGTVRANLPTSHQPRSKTPLASQQTDPFAATVDGATSVGRAVAVFSIMVLSFLATLLVIATAIPN